MSETFEALSNPLICCSLGSWLSNALQSSGFLPTADWACFQGDFLPSCTFSIISSTALSFFLSASTLGTFGAAIASQPTVRDESSERPSATFNEGDIARPLGERFMECKRLYRRNGNSVHQI